MRDRSQPLHPRVTYKTNTRNEALEFAKRTRRNLDFIENAAKQHPSQVHVVTQLTLSLLGLIVFPKEKLLHEDASRMTIEEMQEEGWPTWTITLDEPKKPTRTLWDIVRHLRNAIAHGRLTFTCDSPKMDDVGIFVEDRKNKNDTQPYWSAQMNARDLKRFCFRFLDFIEDRLG